VQAVLVPLLLGNGMNNTTAEDQEAIQASVCLKLVTEFNQSTKYQGWWHKYLQAEYCTGSDFEFHLVTWLYLSVSVIGFLANLTVILAVLNSSQLKNTQVGSICLNLDGSG